MKKLFLISGLILLIAVVAVALVWQFRPDLLERVPGLASLEKAPEVKVEDFHLLDHKGRSRYLHRQSASKAVVLISVSASCPIVAEAVPKIKALRDQFSSKGVVFWLLDSDPQDDRAAIKQQADSWGLDLPILEDRAQLVAKALNIEKTCEAICVSTTNWVIFYRGALDKRLAEGKSTSWLPKTYAEGALTKFLANQKLSPSYTVAKGTSLNLATASNPNEKPDISYANDIAPVLQRSCVPCHSPGNIGPFALSSYERVRGKSSMIREVLLTERMPPWHADPHYGTFLNKRQLTPEQAQRLVQWIDQGSPRGEGADPLAAKAPPPAQEWPLGQPDYIVKFPKAEEIPATGVFDYRYVYARSPIPSNAWLRAAVIKPGNRKAVHHVLVLTMTQQELQQLRSSRQRNSPNGLDGYFTAYVPGYEAAPYPEGTGKFLRAGSVIVFQVHYTATGKPEKDSTEMGLYLCKEKPAVELKTHAAYNVKFKIPPEAAEYESTAEYKFAKDALLYAMSPHMHLRGSRFQYEAIYPDGKKEVLLSVPNYDFKWQHLYHLTKPKRLPAGTRLVCRGAHDNSAQNPANPDSSKQVGFGDQTFDEMFIGYFNYTDAPTASPGLAGTGG